MTTTRRIALGLCLYIAAAPFAAQTAHAQASGINVHGHWTIEVRNPDGSLARHTEFQNALGGSGALNLVRLLTRQRSVGNWAVFLLGPTTQRVCGTAEARLGCSLQEPTDTNNYSGTARLPVLTIAEEGDPAKLVLRGTVTATVSGQVSDVRTLLGSCANTIAPSACPATNPGVSQFTFHVLVAGTEEPPIPIAAGQIVQVTVEISFQ